jgi:hypothetical protein
MSAADDGDRSGRVVVCAVVMTVLSALTVGLRFYVRGKLLGTLKSEDWFILLALVRPLTLLVRSLPEGANGKLTVNLVLLHHVGSFGDRR